MELLSVKNLTKQYEKFKLEDVSFSLDRGYIMGFIGRNGAGKTTTIKTMLNLAHADSGQVFMMGEEFFSHEKECKQKIGLVLGGVSYYPKKKLRTIANVTRRFYTQWDESAYEGFMKQFELDPEKKVDELSDGMRVKFALALALSHHAELLILDEPTSGLDPVSRDDLLELFQELIEDGQRSILYSTHITSDLDKCADYITYMKDGKIIASEEKELLLESYRIVKGKHEQITAELQPKLIGCKKNAYGFEALMRAEDTQGMLGFEVSSTDLESLMIHFEKESVR